MSFQEHHPELLARQTRVFVYARASSKRQADKELSVSAQLRAIRGYAREQQWLIVEEFVDNGYSGRDRKRPALNRMLSCLGGEEIDKIAVWKLDRLARDSILSAAIRERLQETGASLFSLHEPTGESPQEQLMARFFEGIAEFYSANLSQDIKRGQREVARRGFYPFSTAPVGFTRVRATDGKATRFLLKQDPKHGPVISRIFSEYASGQTVPEIVKNLNQEGIKAGKRDRWTAKRLYYVLRNPVYCGDLTIGNKSNGEREVIVVSHGSEALVPRETFERVQAIMDARAGSHAVRRWEDSPYLLSGLVRCGLRGRHMAGESAKSGKHHYYVCQKHRQEGKESCPGVRMPKRQLEDFVV